MSQRAEITPKVNLFFINRSKEVTNGSMVHCSCLYFLCIELPLSGSDFTDIFLDENVTSFPQKNLTCGRKTVLNESIMLIYAKCEREKTFQIILS